MGGSGYVARRQSQGAAGHLGSINRLLPLLLAAVKFASGFVLRLPTYELHRDKYLYFDYGRHLAWGHLEVPTRAFPLFQLNFSCGAQAPRATMAIAVEP